MKEIRIYKGCISEKEAERLSKVSQSIEPCHSKVSNLSTQQLVEIGCNKMKRDGFRIASAHESERTL